MPTININYPHIDKVFNPKYKPYVFKKDRYLIFWGGRGSAKSFTVVDIVIFRMLTHKYFRGLLIRQVSKSIRGSMYQALKDRIIDLQLHPLFTFRESVMEIECANGNKVTAAGLDDPTKIKSVADVTFAWWEEDIPSEDDFVVVTTSIRTTKADYLQEIFSINPEVIGDYNDNWFYKLFFKDRPQTYTGEITAKVEGKDVALTYSTLHSWYRDNPHLPGTFKATLENYKVTNPYYYDIYTLGKWGNRITGSQCYKGFDRTKHVKEIQYNPTLPLHLSFDFNVNPYMTLTVWQVEGKTARQIDEILGKDPNNNTAATCRLFRERYKAHTAGVFIYGDPSGKSEDTRSEKGHNDFTIIQKELKDYHPNKRLHMSAPNVRSRIDWINDVLSMNVGGVKILFNESCKMTITDYQNGKEAADGTKFKEKGKDPNTKITYELYHHITDANDYFLTKCFSSQYKTWMRGGKAEAPTVFSSRRQKY